VSLDVTDGDAVEVGADGVTLLRYRPTTDASKPFAGRVALPSGADDLAGRNLVLAGAHDHAWHLGLFFCPKLVDGINCWESLPAAEDGRFHGRARDAGHEARAGDGTAGLDHEVVWETSEGEALLTEERGVTVHEPGTHGPDDGYLVEWEATLHAEGHERRLSGETVHGRYSGFSARFVRDMDAGRFLLPDDEGAGREVLGSDAPWCDYAGGLDGRVGTLDAASAGMAFFDHPDNPRTSRWFTMSEEFGFVSANPTWDEVQTVEPGDPVTYRWGVWVHAGTPDREQVRGVYESYADS
jgi:hypothetical protein